MRFHIGHSVLIALVVLASLLFGRELPAQMTADSLGLDVSVTQKLDEQVDLSLKFIDHDERPVEFEEYFNSEKPVLLTLVYYECPMLCTQVLNGLIRSLKEMDLTVGEDFSIVSVSIDPGESTELGAKKRRTYLRTYNRDGAEKGWHFLTGDSNQVAQLAEQVGFKYDYDEETDQYAHSAAIMILTPKGKVSKYFYGIEYDQKDLRLGLIEASEERIGSLVDELVLLCFKYDPLTGKYGFVISAALKIGGILTAVIMIGFIAISLRRDKKKSAVISQVGTSQ